MKVTAIAQQRARAVTAQLDSRPSRAPIPSGAVTKGVRHSGPHSPLCGSESAYAGLPHSIPARHRKVGAKCGSESAYAPSAQGTVRTTFADIPGFCKSATTAEIPAHGHVLTPGRSVGAE